jgi:hypothetical protein
MNATLRRQIVPRLLRGLARVGLLGRAYRAFERWESLRSRRRSAAPGVGPDGLPLPPQRLVVLVSGPTSVSGFLRNGRLGADLVRDTLAADGRAHFEYGQRAPLPGVDLLL